MQQQQTTTKWHTVCHKAFWSRILNPIQKVKSKWSTFQYPNINGSDWFECSKWLPTTQKWVLGSWDVDYSFGLSASTLWFHEIFSSFKHVVEWQSLDYLNAILEKILSPMCDDKKDIPYVILQLVMVFSSRKPFSGLLH